MQKRTMLFTLALALVSLLTACGLSSKQKTAARDALKALKKVSAATEVGVNFPQYGQLAIEAKSQVNEAASVLPSGELKTELTAAMDAYFDAGQVWNVYIRNRDLSSSSELGQSIAKKYQFEISIYSTKEQVLSKIWSEASKHVEQASKLLGE